MLLSWPRVEQRRRKEAPLETDIFYVDLAANFIAQWDDEALIRRDKNPQRRTHHTVAVATATWDLYSPASVLPEEGTVDGGE